MSIEQKIVDMYVNQNKSTYEISQNLKTYPNKIRRVLMKHGVKLKTKSQAQKNALDKGVAKIPTKGHKRSEEEKIKISSSMEKRWKNTSIKKYQEHVDKAKKRWYNMPEHERQSMTKSATKAIQKAGKEGSKLEKFIRRELSSFFIVESHKKNLIPNENLEIDIYIPKLKTIIEIDGPSHFLPIWGEEKLQKQIKADENKTGLILGKGFAIIRVKNLSDSVSLSKQHKLKERLIELLGDIKKSFPVKSKRYIELEI